MERLEARLPVARNRHDRERQAEDEPVEEIVALAEEERRSQHDGGDPAPRDERLAFSLAPQIRVGRGGIGADRGHVHEAAGARALGFRDDVRHATHVHGPEGLRALGRHRDRVHDRLAPVEHPAQRLGAAHVHAADLAPGAALRELALRAGPFADERAHGPAGGAQPRDEVPPEEAVGPGDRDHADRNLLRRSSNTSPAAPASV